MQLNQFQVNLLSMVTGSTWIDDYQLKTMGPEPIGIVMKSGDGNGSHIPGW